MNNSEKGIFAPDYYTDFKCIADKCRHSCCVDWEICIDTDTLEKYRQTEDILKTVTESVDGPSFTLTADGRCPHLNNNGLCNIIISHGEEYLCEICREHPRFYNFVNGSRCEAGLGLVCEEACRLILENEASFSLVKIDDISEADGDFDFNSLAYRPHIISVIEGEGSFDSKTDLLKKEYAIPCIHTEEEWTDLFLSLEILDPSWEQTLKAARGKKRKSADEYGKYFCRLLTYFVYRHVSTAVDEIDLRARLGFSLLSVQLIRYLLECENEQSLQSLLDLARRYSAEIEYSEDNTNELISAFERVM